MFFCLYTVFTVSYILRYNNKFHYNPRFLRSFKEPLAEVLFRRDSYRRMKESDWFDSIRFMHTVTISSLMILYSLWVLFFIGARGFFNYRIIGYVNTDSMPYVYDWSSGVGANNNLWLRLDNDIIIYARQQKCFGNRVRQSVFLFNICPFSWRVQ